MRLRQALCMKWSKECANALAYQSDTWVPLTRAPRAAPHSGASRGKNRGNGPTSAYVCLSEREEVIFSRLGLRLSLRAGDLLSISNMYWENDTSVVEDIRAAR
eukprot:1662062-Amphidinium_carterae.1